jgi:uncharacterized RDD family membrane protein YckC
LEDEFFYIGSSKRLWACLIDAFGILILILAVFIFGFSVLGWGNNSAFLWPVAWLFVYSIYVIGSWSRKGQTLGKSLLKVKIVKTDKKPINLGISMLRYFILVGPYIAIIIGGLYLYIENIAKSSFGPLASLGALVLIPVLPVLLNIVIINMSSTKQGIHDRVAHTFVIQTK